MPTLAESAEKPRVIRFHALSFGDLCVYEQTGFTWGTSIQSMVEPFDIFRVSSDDQPLWLETVTALDRAQLRVEELGATSPGEYLIYCHESGDQISINVGGPGKD